MPTIDFGGNDIIVQSIKVGSTRAGQQGTVIGDSSGVISATRFDLDSGTATLSSNAATITKYASVVTTESLTTAHTATQALVITKTGVAAGDIAVATFGAGGTNTGGIPIIQKVTCTTNTVTITLWNAAKTTDAFNGTFLINLIIFKA